MTIHEFFMRTWELLLGRSDWPLTMRLVLQPAIAAVFAIRAARRDIRDSARPFFFVSVFTNPARRPELLEQVREDVGKVFGMAVALDVVYELIVYRWVYPGQAVITATVLAIVPYLLARGPVTQAMRR